MIYNYQQETYMQLYREISSVYEHDFWYISKSLIAILTASLSKSVVAIFKYRSCI